ncbi:pro-sigmaK processing inhibitor BofA family protein [Thermoanaerobacter sp. CM-CNRG TB177]|jgi:inhibitor of the pro-sigma K processing machinery|uniref:Pro-sigmaK processing inhibitor BofA n=1 Tax=Thermoanaerobacter italicus (strain DSM 9252 / Ab9) TaxID=580331 RepID=D3T569_THEIA|nr:MULTISPECIES: pro-sigmaK processing inhibitor BofA family protein [Thermoanaerobacter]ADD01370.1 pro-sigmaK processing inhibitor BofA [Thermoanaerobacter italicus Ab9]MBT1279428.1 pro-sigmaK processing inhibitor BofA family protein [Thermoanaerobacter sp. CM-CNRG TB177]MDK2814373.1 inhibitor of the pro-sigma processing machinery [Thermoanaerobacter sp.]
MNISIEYNIIIAYLIGLFLLYFLGWLLVVPKKFLLKIIINGIIGGLILLIINLLGKSIGLYIAINPVTALVAGFLGIPGIILLIILQYIA